MSRSCRFRPTYSSLSTVAYGKRYDGSVCVSLTYCNDGGVWYFDAANLATEHLCRVAVDVPRQRSVKACCSGRPTAAERQGVLQWTSHGRGASRRVTVDVPRQRNVEACFSGRPTAEELRRSTDRQFVDLYTHDSQRRVFYFFCYEFLVDSRRFYASNS